MADQPTRTPEQADAVDALVTEGWAVQGVTAEGDVVLARMGSESVLITAEGETLPGP